MSPNGGRWASVALFTGTAFVGAVLLFWIQPLFTKMALPLLGGTPSVWNTALVFFQAMLLAGYGYAHALARWLRPRHQLAAHGALLCAAGLTLPIGIGDGWVPDATAPAAWLMALLAAAVGAPFLAVAATAPLLQRWFSLGGHPRAHDPYFLYAASNAGSVAVLLAFPFVLEPLLTTRAQSLAWTIGFGVLAAGVIACGAAVAGARPGSLATAAPSAPAGVRWRQRGAWMAYSAVPSALLIGVTGHIGTDIASAPLLWVVPLALYLLTFVNAFARRPWIPGWLASRAMALALALLAAVFVWREPAGVFLPLHLGAFGCVALACHAELARRRPAAGALTEFYLFLSLGGLAGGALVALAAPRVFDTVLEYPLALALAAALVPARGAGARGRGGGGARGRGGEERRWPLRRGDLLVAAAVAAGALGLQPALGALGRPTPVVVYGCVTAVLAAVTLSRQVRPAAFALCIGLLLLGASRLPQGDDTVWTGRSFFGVYRVTEQTDPPARNLIHGTTNHGGQWMPTRGALLPSAYYTAASPAVAALESVRNHTAGGPLRVGVVGLGAGAIAYWRRPGERWRYYEIDPLVVWLATRSGYFGLLGRHDPDARIVLGDARLGLAREADGRFDLLVLDAFTSAAIPTHLLTQEAMALFMRKLRPEGVLLLHISNRQLDLEPVVAANARALGHAALAGRPSPADEGDEGDGGRDPTAAGSLWVALARDEERLRALALGDGWTALRGAAGPGGERGWRDDFSSVVGIVRWTGGGSRD